MNLQPTWPPCTGDPLPRADEAYAEPEKLSWLLSDEGHGGEWARVLLIRRRDADRFWEAIGEAVIGAPVIRVTDREPFGVACGVEIFLAVGSESPSREPPGITSTLWRLPVS